MARALMACVPAYGLANPSFPFAKALVEAGHQVDYLIPESFRGSVERAGATLIPFGQLDVPITRPRHAIAHGRGLFREMNDGIRRLGPGYDVVLACGVNPEIPDLERALDCPVGHVSPVFFQNERTLQHLVSIATGLPAPARKVLRTPGLRRAASRVIGPLILDTRRADLLDMLRPQSSSLNISPASRYYQPFDEDFSDRCLFVGPTPTLSAPDESFPLDRLRRHLGPVVYATLGTVFNRWTAYFRTIAEAFAGSDALVVLTTGNKDRVTEVGPTPDNVILRSFVPQTDVLREADLCFTHGGFGSVTDTVAMGVPAILTPMGADQFFNAYRMRELDAGRVLEKAKFNVESVRRLAGEVLAAPPAGLTRLRESFRTAGGPARATRAVEALLEGPPAAKP